MMKKLRAKAEFLKYIQPESLPHTVKTNDCTQDNAKAIVVKLSQNAASRRPTVWSDYRNFNYFSCVIWYEKANSEKIQLIPRTTGAPEAILLYIPYVGKYYISGRF